MINDTKEHHKGRSRIVFAGQEGVNNHRQIGVVYEKNAGFSTHIAPNRFGKIVKMPDRTLYLYSRQFRKSDMPAIPMDAIVSYGLSPTMWEDLNTDVLLFNSHHANANCCTKSLRAAGIECIFDSGGFQMIQGTLDFVDPINIVKDYNKNASIGMGLDLPSPPAIDDMFYVPNCKLQKLNNELMRETLSDRVTLAPIVHGHSPRTRLHCLKTVASKNDKVLALANLQLSTLDTISSFKMKLACLALVLHRTRGHVVYYHLLGVTSIFWRVAMAFLCLKDYAISMGGDSVSHRQHSMTGTYHTPHFYDNTTAMNTVKTSRTASGLPCGCPVCLICKDARMLDLAVLHEIHEAYIAANSNELVRDNVLLYIRGAIGRNELYNSIIPKGDKTNRQRMNIFFDYFERVVTLGYDKTPKLYEETESFPKQTSTDLFGITTGKKSALVDRYTEIHGRYAKYHKTTI